MRQMIRLSSFFALLLLLFYSRSKKQNLIASAWIQRDRERNEKNDGGKFMFFRETHGKFVRNSLLPLTKREMWEVNEGFASGWYDTYFPKMWHVH